MRQDATQHSVGREEEEEGTGELVVGLEQQNHHLSSSRWMTYHDQGVVAEEPTRKASLSQHDLIQNVMQRRQRQRRKSFLSNSYRSDRSDNISSTGSSSFFVRSFDVIKNTFLDSDGDEDGHDDNDIDDDDLNIELRMDQLRRKIQRGRTRRNQRAHFYKQEEKVGVVPSIFQRAVVAPEQPEDINENDNDGHTKNTDDLNVDFQNFLSASERDDYDEEEGKYKPYSFLLSSPGSRSSVVRDRQPRRLPCGIPSRIEFIVGADDNDDDDDSDVDNVDNVAVDDDKEAY